jgi:hypothetical protein
MRSRARATLEIEQAIIAVAEERAPTTVRGIAYVLFIMRLIRSMDRSNTRRVSEIATRLREDDSLDWRLIVDNSRPTRKVSMWDSPVELMEAAVAQYRRDNWRDQPFHIELWSEKNTVGGILAPVIDRWGIRFVVMTGYGSHTRIREAVERAQDAAKAGKMPLALYVGDWDPSGLDMSERDLPKRMAAFDAPWQIKRIAIVAGDHRLPSFAASDKRKDSRYPWFVRTYGHRCWELDAMDHRDLRRRVEQAIEHYVDHAAWEDGLKNERAEKESLDAFIAGWEANPD